MLQKTNAQKILIEKINDFISKNRCSLPDDDVAELEDCLGQLEDLGDENQSAGNKSLILKLLSKAAEVLVKYLLFKEIHDFFDN